MLPGRRECGADVLRVVGRCTATGTGQHVRHEGRFSLFS